MYSQFIKYYRKFKAIQIKGNHPRRVDATDLQTMDEVVCKNCSTTYHGRFCPVCGQSAGVGRLRIMQGISDLVGIFTNFESGFFHTCLELIYRPGYMIYDFIKGHRKEYIKPIQLLFLLTTILMIEHFLLYGTSFSAGSELNIDEEKLGLEKGTLQQVVSIVESVTAWLIENKAVSSLLIVSLLVLPNKICFRKTEVGKSLNVSEHFFVMVYIACQVMMCMIVEMPCDYIMNSHDGYADIGLGVPPLLILLWDFNQLFHLSLAKTMRLTLLSYVLALFLLILVLALVITAIVVIAVAFNYY